MDQLSGLVVKKQQNATLAERHHHLVWHANAHLFEACYTDSKHAVRRRVQLKSDLWELELIIIDASVKWELTPWPHMDMVNVAVSHLVAGPRIGGLGLCLAICGAHYRFVPGIIDMVLRSLDHLLNIERRILNLYVRIPRYSHHCSLGAL